MSPRFTALGTVPNILVPLSKLLTCLLLKPSSDGQPVDLLVSVAYGPVKDPLLLASVEVWAGPQPLPASPGVDPQKNRRRLETPNNTF